MAGRGQETKTAALPVGTLEQIRQADDTHQAGMPVEVPEWGWRVLGRGLPRAEATAWTQIEDQRGSDIHLLKCSLVAPTVTDEQAAELVDTKSAAALRRVLKEVIEVSGLAPSFREDTPG